MEQNNLNTKLQLPFHSQNTGATSWPGENNDWASVTLTTLPLDSEDTKDFRQGSLLEAHRPGAKHRTYMSTQ